VKTRTCPKCRGTGNIGTLASYRCDLCSGAGKLEIWGVEEYVKYRQACHKYGIPPEHAHEDWHEDEAEWASEMEDHDDWKEWDPYTFDDNPDDDRYYYDEHDEAWLTADDDYDSY
jgi:hypothetical protein